MTSMLASAPPLPSRGRVDDLQPVPVMPFFTVDSKAKASVTTVVSVQNTS